MATCLRIKDYRGLRHLTPEQEQQLAAARAAHTTAAAQPLQMPTAQLSSGYDIPLVGLGTWWVQTGILGRLILWTRSEWPFHSVGKEGPVYLVTSAGVAKPSALCIYSLWTQCCTTTCAGMRCRKASPGQVRSAVLAAVRCGYRHIDCASIYGNEHEVCLRWCKYPDSIWQSRQLEQAVGSISCAKGFWQYYCLVCSATGSW